MTGRVSLVYSPIVIPAHAGMTVKTGRQVQDIRINPV
jgi:hypothetical protein